MHDAQTSDAVLQHCNNLLVYFISLCLFALRDPLIALQHLLHLARTPYIIELGKHKNHDFDVRNSEPGWSKDVNFGGKVCT